MKTEKLTPQDFKENLLNQHRQQLWAVQINKSRQGDLLNKMINEIRPALELNVENLKIKIEELSHSHKAQDTQLRRKHESALKEAELNLENQNKEIELTDAKLNGGNIPITNKAGKVEYQQTPGLLTQEQQIIEVIDLIKRAKLSNE